MSCQSSQIKIMQGVLKAHKLFGKGPTQTATIPEIRDWLPEIARTDLDRALRELNREGVLFLGKAVDLAVLSARDRAACLRNSEGTLLLYVSAGQAHGRSVASRGGGAEGRWLEGFERRQLKVPGH